MWLERFFTKKPKAQATPNHVTELPESSGGILHVSFTTNAGNVRTENQDNFFVTGYGEKKTKACSDEIQISDAGLCIFAVFDGMGGEAYGEEASAIAAVTLKECYPEFTTSNENKIPLKVQEFVKKANAKICRMIQEKHCGRSGCTMVLVCILRGMVYAFSVGDSRIYLHNATFQQISEDQTLAMKKFKANIYTAEEARNSRDAHQLTAYIGMDNRNVGIPMLSYQPFPLMEGQLLLCSDGLTDMCSDTEIASLLQMQTEHSSSLLVERALQNGGQDNVTCIVIKYEKKSV